MRTGGKGGEAGTLKRKVWRMRVREKGMQRERWRGRSAMLEVRAVCARTQRLQAKLTRSWIG